MTLTVGNGKRTLVSCIEVHFLPPTIQSTRLHLSRKSLYVDFIWTASLPRVTMTLTVSSSGSAGVFIALTWYWAGLAESALSFRFIRRTVFQQMCFNVHLFYYFLSADCCFSFLPWSQYVSHPTLSVDFNCLVYTFFCLDFGEICNLYYIIISCTNIIHWFDLWNQITWNLWLVTSEYQCPVHAHKQQYSNNNHLYHTA